MIKYLSLIGLLWLGGHFTWKVDYVALYGRIVSYAPEYELLHFGYAFTLSIGLVLLAYLLRALRMFALLHLISRVFFEVSQMAICLIVFSSVAFWLYLPTNLWKDLGIFIVSTPYLLLFSSCLSLRIYDFNYPLADKLLNYSFLTGASIIAVWVMSVTV